MSLQSFFTAVQNWIVETESQVQQVIVQIQTEIPVAEAAINSALKWVANQAPTVASDVQIVTGLIAQMGMTSNPNIAQAVTEANVAVQALNAFAAAENTGTSNAQAVVNGYVAFKQAQASVASATAAAVASAKAAAVPGTTAAVAAGA